MNCRDVRMNLITSPEEGSDSQRQAEINGHLSDCVECREYAQVVKLWQSAIHEEKETDYDPYLFTRIQAAMENRKEGRHVYSRLVLRPLAYAMVFIFLIVAGIGLGRMFSEQNSLAADYQTEIYYLQDTQGFIQTTLGTE